jgi:hypothetical protein
MASFGEKLDFLKEQFDVTDGEIASGSGTVASLVCRWRSGERKLDREKDHNKHTIELLATFFVKRAVLERKGTQLAEILSYNGASLKEADIDAGNRACIIALKNFFFDGLPIRETAGPEEDLPSLAPDMPGNFIGVKGALNALTLLEKKLEARPETEMAVYLSLQYSRLPHDDTVGDIWEIVYRMNGDKPVRVVFDWLADERQTSDMVARNLAALLPFMQTGKIQLHVIKSTQKFFYYNLTFFAKDAGMVLTTEPAGGMGVNISLLAESRSYVKGMGAVFADLDNMSKSLARNIGGARDESIYYGRLFAPTEDVRILSGGLNLLYLDEKSYLSLLLLNGIKKSQRDYRHGKFIEDKRRFDALLDGKHVKEVVCLPALDRMIAEQCIETPDLSFYSGKVKADKAILKNFLERLLEYTERYANLSICLERGADMDPAFTCRIKGDSFVLLHTRDTGKAHALYSDNWMLVYEYLKRFGEALGSEQLMNTKSAVSAALRMRLENLEGE